MNQFFQQDTVTCVAQFNDVAGVGIDLSSYTVNFVVWRRGDSSASIDVDQTDPAVTVNAGSVDGAVEAVIASDECTALGTYVIQIQAQSADSPPITRSTVRTYTVIDAPALGGLGV